MPTQNFTEKDSVEFKGLITQHSERAFNFAYRLTGNKVDAGELVQQAFTNALKSFGRFERSRPFAPWLNRILKNIFLDNVRKTKGRQTFSLDAPSPVQEVSWEQLIPGDDPTPLEEMEKQETTRLVQKALNELPEPFKSAVILCDVERFTYQRISEVLECPVGTVRSRIHQGRTKLKQIYERNLSASSSARVLQSSIN
jgi:RNA polymerase sigma-70 factor, ECF subfamily